VFASIIEWLLEQVASIIIHRWVNSGGAEHAADKLQVILHKATPLPPDPLPSPASLRNPNREK